ncbi:MAG: S8 family serine peptidase, partial [Spirochaetota bacterium]|nr:S8 family serine peptidase [Spirochaetota bacterium]
ILSMSLGGPVYDHAYSDAITYSLDHDVIVVAAAGNGGDDGIGDDNDITPQYPSSFSQENVIAVAALDQAYELADFSNFGSTSVDVGAPGTNIWSAYDIELIDWDVITNDYSSGWTLTGDWNIWDYSGDGSLYLLRNPSDWYFSNYANNADDSAYQSFDLSGWDGAFFTSGICFDLQDGYDFLNIYASPSSGNPCLDVNNLVDYWTGTTPGYNDPPGYYTFYPFDFDVSSCATSTGTVGINLTSNDSVTAGGIALWNYSFSRIHLADNLYACWNGTSMATPHVSGLAAMIWAYNPDYTYADVINSVKNGGDDVSALSGNTTTGKAVDAWGSLCYINQPTGVTATLE